ncbi:MAG: Maf family protein, partial [Coriobacteriia bacterium]|nr:Maf family protein [Coriobacteriia bacterium]
MPFATTSVEVDEELDSPLASHPPSLAAHLAARKALAARNQGAGAASLILCFDTIVVLDYQILGKPRDVDEAWSMLRALSGRTHEVVTGVAILPPSAEVPRTFSVTTNVRMKSLGDLEIESWMERGEFMTCAGAYNIEGQIAEV